MKRRMLFAIVLTFGCVASEGMQDPSVPAVPPAPPVVQEAEEVRRALVAWFECDECLAGELTAVVKHGDVVVPLLQSTLREGAAAPTRELLRRALAQRYEEIQAYAQTHPYVKLRSTQAEYIAYNLDNLDAQYKVRAAQALAALGGPQARAALEQESLKANRPDVKRAIKASMMRFR